ncbi:MAG: SpoIID/LytB domain-containing protein [Ignavibacteriaceae bacterium]|nr:SpoIID/LytB domain-containing protein [Ignavibacteriaceae bacterium]
MTEPVLSVGVLKAKQINVIFYGDYYTEEGDRLLSGNYLFTISGNEIKVSGKSGEFTFSDNLVINPSSADIEHFTIKDVIIGIQFHWERKEKQSFKGSLRFSIEDDCIWAVNLINIEEYLRSVISSEMNARSNINLLKAHSVISRSWVLSQIEKSKQLTDEQKKDPGFTLTDDTRIKWYDREDHTLFDVCADDHCQRYQGITKIFTESADNAVKETRGLVLKYGSDICDARYYKSCGGVTEPFENVWEDKHYPYLIAVIDYKFEPDGFNLDFTDEKNAVKWLDSDPPAYCNTTDKKILSQVLPHFDQETTDFYRWQVEYTNEQLRELILKKSGIDFGEITDMVPLKRGPSARIIELRIAGRLKTMTIGKELEIRRLLSESHLYSSAFFVKKLDVKDGVPGRFILKGAGWGHGVGLCQIGAAVMAEKGFMFDEILLHYYRNAQLVKAY